MATIRALMIAGAVVLHAAAPADAQSARAPLQLVPGDGQASRTAQSGTVTKAATPRAQNRKAAKKAGKAQANSAAAKSRTARTSAANRVAQPAAKKASRTATAPTPGRNLARARAVPGRAAEQAISAALPEARGQDTAESMSFAPRPSQQAMDVQARNKASRQQASREQASQDNVMRDGDSVSLIARLPWWRNNPLQPIHYGSEEAESQVLAAADAWLLASARVVAESHSPGENGNAIIVVADAGEVNAIDRASAAPVFASAPAPAVPTFGHSLIAILAGAVAAAAVAAASARFLFA